MTDKVDHKYVRRTSKIKILLNLPSTPTSAHLALKQ